MVRVETVRSSRKSCHRMLRAQDDEGGQRKYDLQMHPMWEKENLEFALDLSQAQIADGGRER